MGSGQKPQRVSRSVVSQWTPGPFSLESVWRFDCNFGNEFGTIRNVPGSLGVVIFPGEAAQKLKRWHPRIFPFRVGGGDTETRKAEWWVEVVKALLENERTKLQIWVWKWATPSCFLKSGWCSYQNEWLKAVLRDQGGPVRRLCIWRIKLLIHHVSPSCFKEPPPQKKKQQESLQRSKTPKKAVGCSGDTCRVVCDKLCGCETRLVPQLLAGGISTMKMVFVYRFSADLKINKGGNGGSLL